MNRMPKSEEKGVFTHSRSSGLEKNRIKKNIFSKNFSREQEQERKRWTEEVWGMKTCAEHTCADICTHTYTTLTTLIYTA